MPPAGFSDLPGANISHEAKILSTKWLSTPSLRYREPRSYLWLSVNRYTGARKPESLEVSFLNIDDIMDYRTFISLPGNLLIITDNIYRFLSPDPVPIIGTPGTVIIKVNTIFDENPISHSAIHCFHCIIIPYIELQRTYSTPKCTIFNDALIIVDVFIVCILKYEYIPAILVYRAE